MQCIPVPIPSLRKKNATYWYYEHSSGLSHIGFFHVKFYALTMFLTGSSDKKYLKSADCIKYYKVCCAKQTACHLFDDDLENTDYIDDDNDTESLNGTDSYYWETNKKCEYNTAHWVLFELRRNVQIKKLLIKFNHVQIKTDDLAFEYSIDISYG
jgi:hypothetical protein